MKKILILIPFLILSWAGSTWFIGNETELLLKDYIKNTKNAYAEMGMETHIDIKGYEKSFLKSTAKTIFSLNTGDPELDDLFKEVPFNNTISHGPLLWVKGMPRFGTAYIHSTLDIDSLGAETQDILKKLFANKNPLNSNILFGLNETADYDLIIPAIDIKEDVSVFSLKDGIYLSGTGNKNTLMGTVKGTIGKIKINDDGLLIDISASTVDVDMQGMVAGQMLGTTHFEIPSIKIEGEEMPPTSFSIDFSSNMEQVENKALDGSLKLIASNIKAPIDISTIHLNALFKGYQIKGLEQLVAIQKDLQQLQSGGLSGDMNSEEQEALMNKIQNLPNVMVAAVQNTLKKDKTTLSLNLDIASKQGKALLTIDGRYIGNGADINLEELSTNGLVALLKIIAGKIDFNTPKTMIANTPAAFFMPSLVEQGLIAENDDSYRLNAIFETNSITLNDKAVSVDEFITLLTALGLGGTDDELPEGVESSDNIDLPADLPAGVFEELSEQLGEEELQGLVEEASQTLEPDAKEPDAKKETAEVTEDKTQQ
ncbi:MAG: DUF945 family protein [Cocleimonas sp.]|nr:DUF945 family protein [Cocleimonas sp.]